MDNETDHAIYIARPDRGLLKPELEKLGLGSHRTHPGTQAKPHRRIALVESSAFMQDCMRRSMEEALSLPVVAFGTFAELERQFPASIALVVLSLAGAGQADCASALVTLSALSSSVPIVVLAPGNDIELARTAIRLGAKGYIPCSLNFEIGIEAVRFILAGGTYAPIEYLLASGPISAPTRQAAALYTVLTDREVRVARAVREGKSNKLIAYELCICEGTVKVHIRNIMKKLKAKNRTDIAIKAHASLSLDFEPPKRAITGAYAASH